jgi:hypothetical protein
MLNKSIFAIVCCSFLGCSLPLTVDDDITGVSGGIVPPATLTQRVMSRFESNDLKEPVASQVEPNDSFAIDDAGLSDQATAEAQNVQTPIYSPLLP